MDSTRFPLLSGSSRTAAAVRSGREAWTDPLSGASLDDSSPELSLTVDDTGIVTVATGRGQRAFGFLHAEVVGMWLPQLVHPDDVVELGLRVRCGVDAERTDPVRVITREGLTVAAELHRYPPAAPGAPLRVDIDRGCS